MLWFQLGECTAQNLEKKTNSVLGYLKMDHLYCFLKHLSKRSFKIKGRRWHCSEFRLSLKVSRHLLCICYVLQEKREKKAVLFIGPFQGGFAVLQCERKETSFSAWNLCDTISDTSSYPNFIFVISFCCKTKKVLSCNIILKCLLQST